MAEWSIALVVKPIAAARDQVATGRV